MKQTPKIDTKIRYSSPQRISGIYSAAQFSFFSSLLSLIAILLGLTGLSLL